MRKPATLLLSSLTLLVQTAGYTAEKSNPALIEQKAPSKGASTAQPSKAPTPSFAAFTGKVTKSKVRLRQQPSLESPILKELHQGDLLIIVGEDEDFYAVQPPADIKAFVFRSYILDNVVEANNVNVRLEPDTEAPIIAQLSAGDRIEGKISTTNNKWLEIAPPASARFYVAKDYIEKLGDPTLLAKIEKRREDVNLLLNSTYLASQNEMHKSFPDIHLNTVFANLNKIIESFQDFPDQVSRAKELLSQIQDEYVQKKIVYLESKAKLAQDDWQNKNSQLNEQMRNQQQKLVQLEQQLQKQKGNKQGSTPPIVSSQNINNNPAITNKMAVWLPVEQAIYESWTEQHPGHSQEDFYDEQSQEAVSLRGIIEPYTRVIKNKPGDYVIVNQANHLPIAFLYSTQVNLQEKLGQEVTIYGITRPNNNFAFPAYFVLSIE